MKLGMKWMVCVITLLAAWQIAPDRVAAHGALAVVIAGSILWLANILLRPVFQIVSLPLTLLTLGLFSLVVNAGMVGLTSAIVPAFAVRGFGTCLLIALVISLANCVIAADVSKKH